MSEARGASPRREWRSRAEVIGWCTSLIALFACTVAVASATVAELRYLVRAELPTPPEVTRDIVVTNAADAFGRRASFRILLFTDEFRWRLSSHHALDADPDRPTFTDEMKAVLNSAEEIIAVGASSEELPGGLSAAEGRRTEEHRAGRRAERIAVWVREALSQPIPIRKLNVGHHAATRGPRAGDTSDQRRVVIVLVLDREEGVNIDQALRAAMARESVRAPIFEALLTRYSLSAGQAFTWVP